ncbi:MAG: hypothetical protein PSX36_12200 [bacterium]|nr:hypothetical protein [bacterium]
MTIQKTEIRFRGKMYEVILEDGVVSYVDPLEPGSTISIGQPSDLKITTLDGAKRMAIKMIMRTPDPIMTFSD